MVDLNQQDDEIGEQIVSFKPQKSIVVGQNGSLILCCQENSTVVARGSNGSGQCDVETWKNIVEIEAGGQCTIGRTADGKLLMAGSLF